LRGAVKVCLIEEHVCPVEDQVCPLALQVCLIEEQVCPVERSSSQKSVIVKLWIVIARNRDVPLFQWNRWGGSEWKITDRDVRSSDPDFDQKVDPGVDQKVTTGLTQKSYRPLREEIVCILPENLPSHFFDAGEVRMMLIFEATLRISQNLRKLQNLRRLSESLRICEISKIWDNLWEY
jgi:hypothetical protein